MKQKFIGIKPEQRNILLIVAGLLLFILATEYVSSEEVPSKPTPQPRAGSENYYKPQKELLPGEEVVTPSGKKMKVWSTRGPVETSPAPDPFSQSGSPAIGGVIVDYDAAKRGLPRATGHEGAQSDHHGRSKD